MCLVGGGFGVFIVHKSVRTKPTQLSFMDVFKKLSLDCRVFIIKYSTTIAIVFSFICIRDEI